MQNNDMLSSLYDNKYCQTLIKYLLRLFLRFHVVLLTILSIIFRIANIIIPEPGETHRNVPASYSIEFPAVFQSPGRSMAVSLRLLLVNLFPLVLRQTSSRKIKYLL